LPETGFQGVLRDWAPGVFLLAGYWLPGRLYSRPNERLEAWLMTGDRRWLGAEVSAGRLGLPGLVRNALELTYLFCYPLVPVAFGLVYFSEAGGSMAASVADRFWAPVLLAVFACYGLLPWLPTRPPRALQPQQDGAPRGSGVRRLNLQVLKHASIQVNTFPSGHVAAALACAFTVGQVDAALGLLIGLLACSIAVAAVLGRYHYAADAILGALVAAIAFAVTRPH
jgi:membrane-associated phospholipid phosphatase